MNFGQDNWWIDGGKSYGFDGYGKYGLGVVVGVICVCEMRQRKTMYEQWKLYEQGMNGLNKGI